MTTKPHQDPIHQGLRRTPSDGLAAAMLRIDELESKILKTATAAGEGDGVHLQKIQQLANRVQDLEDRYAAAQRIHELDTQRIQALESQIRTMHTVLKANKILPE